MNARIHKEIRSLAPAVITLAVLQLVVHSISEYVVKVAGGTGRVSVPDEPFRILLYAVGCLIIGVLVFGRDIVNRTIPQMISQPVRIEKLWNEKLLVASIAFALLFIEFFILTGLDKVSGLKEFVRITSGSDASVTTARVVTALKSLAVFGIVTALFTLGVGVCFTLATRQVVASFWGVAVTALAVWMGINLGVYEAPLAAHEFWIQATAFALLGAGGIWAARRQFLNFQDTESLSANVDISLGRLFSRRKTQATIKFIKRGPLLTLVRKELALQQINMVFIGLAWLVLLISMSVVYARTSEIGLAHSGTWKTLLDLGKVLTILSPFLIGAAAFAEENNMGVSQWQLTLPVSRMKVWTIKTSVCVVLALITGGFAFWCVSQLPRVNPEPSWMVVLYFMFPISAVLIGMYASSFAGNYLQAVILTATICGVLSGWKALIGWGGASLPSVGFGIYLGLIVVFAFLTYGRARPGSMNRNALGRFSLGVALITLAAGLWSVVGKNRTWEILTLPTPGGVEYSQRFGNIAPQLSLCPVSAVGAIGPDGSLWRIGNDITRPMPQQRYLMEPLQIGRGTNWVQVVANPYGQIALKNDGTLWAVGQNHLDSMYPAEMRIRQWLHLGEVVHTATLLPIETGRLWKKISTGSPDWPVYALDRDGRIFKLGDSEPIVESSGWIDIACMGDSLFALKADGSLWFKGENRIVRNYGMDGVSGSASDELHLALPDSSLVEIDADIWELRGIQSDGTRRVWNTYYDTRMNEIELLSVREDGSIEAKRLNRLFKPEIVDSPWEGNNWLFIARFHMRSELALTKDGTLWHAGRSGYDGLKSNGVSPFPTSKRPRPIGRLIAPENLPPELP